MQLRTLVRDCLFLNWALPVESLPAPPRPLRYEIHPGAEGGRVFVSAVVFRQEGMHWPTVPHPRLSYPQCNVRVCVLDDENERAVLFWRELVPAWVVPGARLFGRQPATRASFTMPAPGRKPESAEWEWKVEAGDAKLSVVARVGAPTRGGEPRFPSWEALVEHLRQRPVGYAVGSGGLQRVSSAHPPVAVWPLVAEIRDASLVQTAIPGARLDALPELHSAWLLPEIPLVFALAPATEPVALPDSVPAAG